jgi:hypothetical protein
MNFFPEETDSTLRRIYSVASALLPVVTAAAAYWGLEHAASAASGGLIVLLCGLWTHAAVKGGFSTSPKRMKRRLRNHPLCYSPGILAPSGAVYRGALDFCPRDCR